MPPGRAQGLRQGPPITGVFVQLWDVSGRGATVRARRKPATGLASTFSRIPVGRHTFVGPFRTLALLRGARLSHS